MNISYKYKVYPTKIQIELLQKTFGCVRFVYNYYLNRRIEEYRTNHNTMSYCQCCSDLTSLKQELDWLREPDKCALQNSLKDLDNAYKNFFNGQASFPKFKSKKIHDYSYRTNCNIKFLDKYIQIPKIGLLKIRGGRKCNGRILNATISQKSNGKYYISLCCTDITIKALPKTNKSIGIDLGIKNYCTFSDQTKIDTDKYFCNSSDKLALLQQKLSRKTRDSHRYNKLRQRIANLQFHIHNQRLDFMHKLSTSIIKQYDIICIETLNIKEMLQNSNKDTNKTNTCRLHKNISDMSWSEFVIQLEYKAKWYGKTVSKIDQYYPSSQKCHICGHINTQTKDLSVREWICPQCGTKHDRDVNAAINILNEGLRIINS